MVFRSVISLIKYSDDAEKYVYFECRTTCFDLSYVCVPLTNLNEQFLFIANFFSIQYYEELKKRELRLQPVVFPPNFVSKVHLVRSEEDFDNQMKNAGNKLVVVDFFSTSCGPCYHIAPHLDLFSDKYQSQIIALKIDAYELYELKAKFQVSAFPTFIFYKNGKIVERYSDDDEVTLEETIKKFAEWIIFSTNCYFVLKLIVLWWKINE